MKKNLMLILSIFTFVMLIPCQSQALDISIGANTWYSWWDFDTGSNNENMKFEPALLYGPLVSVRFLNDWSVSSVFMYGSYKLKESGGGGPDGIDRYDSDTLLNYSISKYFKVFAGVKFMGFQWDESQGSGTHRGFGPGFGIALTAPLTDKLFLLFNVSGLYLNTKHKQEYSYQNTSGTVTLDVTETGANSMISLAYYFTDISTSLSLGFRAQYVKMDFKDNDQNNQDSNMLFYGLTLSAVYSFDI